MRRATLLGVSLLLVLSVSGFQVSPLDEAGEKEKKAGGWLGISIQDITPKIVRQKGLKSEEGAYITEVLEESPAESAGLEKGDVIVEFGGKAISDADDLAKAVSKTPPGTKAGVVVLRKGERKTIQVTTGKMQKSHAFAFGFPHSKAPIIRMFRESHSLGLHLRELNPQLGGYFGAPEDEGVLVEEVESKSPGEKAGFKAGDVILKMGKRSINDVRDVWRVLESYRNDGKVDAGVLRKGSRITLSVEIEADDDETDKAIWFQTFPRRGAVQGFRMEAPDFDFMIPDLPEIRIEGELNGLRRLDHIQEFRNLPEYVKSLRSI